MLDSPYPITNRRSIGFLIRKITRLDLNTAALRQRPNTKWKPLLVTYVLYKIALLDVPLGRICGELPEYIKNSKSVIALDNNPNNGASYDDNLCLFRAYALHNKV